MRSSPGLVMRRIRKALRLDIPERTASWSCGRIHGLKGLRAYPRPRGQAFLCDLVANGPGFLWRIGSAVEG